MVCGLLDGESLRDAACRGVAAGSAATLAVNHQLCHPDDVERLLRDIESSDASPAEVRFAT